MTKVLAIQEGTLHAYIGDLEPFTEQDARNVMKDITLLFRWKESKIARTTLRGLLVAVQENFPTTALGPKKADILVKSPKESTLKKSAPGPIKKPVDVPRTSREKPQVENKPDTASKDVKVVNREVEDQTQKPLAKEIGGTGDAADRSKTEKQQPQGKPEIQPATRSRRRTSSIQQPQQPSQTPVQKTDTRNEKEKGVASEQKKQSSNNVSDKLETRAERDRKRLSVRLRNISPITVESNSDSKDSPASQPSSPLDSKMYKLAPTTSARVTRSVTGHLNNVPAEYLVGTEEKTPVKEMLTVDAGSEEESGTPVVESVKPKRGRGRPRKVEKQDKEDAETSKSTASQATSTPKALKVVLDADIEGLCSEPAQKSVREDKNEKDDTEDDELVEVCDAEDEVSLPKIRRSKRSRSQGGKVQDDTLPTPTKRAKNVAGKNETVSAEESSSNVPGETMVETPTVDKEKKNSGNTQPAISLLRNAQMGPDKRQFDLTDYLSIQAAPLKRKRILELADVVSIDKPKVPEEITKEKADTEEHDEETEEVDECKPKPEFSCSHCSRRRGPSYMRNSKEKEYHESCHAVLDGVIQTVLYKCPYCGVLVKGWGGYLNHAIKHEAAMVELDGTSFLENVSFKCKCDECGKQFFHKKARDKHRSEAHSKQLVSCNICKKKLFANKTKEVLRHLDICRNIIYRCDYCEYLTVVRADMRTHVGYHDKNPVCEICHMGFPNKTLMETHKINLHDWTEQKKEIKCAHCDESYRDAYTLRRHLKMYHADVEQESYECASCRFVAPSEDKLLDHEVVAHQKEYQCTKCSFGTNSEITLEQHMDYHNRDGKYPCAYENCGFLGIDVRSMNKHVELEHVGREFTCPFCSKTFKKKALLDRHVTTHPTAKTFKCGRCAETFNLFSDYHRHKEDTGHDSQPGMPSTLPAYKALHSLESEEDQLIRLLVASVHVQKEGEQDVSETAYNIQAAGNNLLVDKFDVLHTPDMIASIPAVQSSRSGEIQAHKENDDTFEAASVLMDLCGKQQNLDPRVIDCPIDMPTSTEKKRKKKSSKKVTLVMSEFPGETNALDNGTNKSRLPCPYCKCRTFANSEDLQFHISSHVESEGVVVSDTYRCQICTKICTKWLRFLHHLATHRDQHKDLMKFSFMEDIIGHFECEICHRVFEHHENLKLHHRYMHKGTKEYTMCDICNQVIYSLDIREIDRHLDGCRQVTYRCDFCEYTTLYQNDMKSHSLYHSSGFKCKTCQVTFYSKADLVKHQAAIHKTDGQTVKPKCQICGETFASKKLLHTHLQENHEDEVQWTNVCDVCGYKAATISALQKHTKENHPKTKMQCYLCRYKTFSEASLIKHMKEHEKKKRELVCGKNGCEFTTYIKDHLRAHQKSVHAARNHICPVCGKGFKRKPALHRHIVNHPERKNYTCGDCQKVFTKFSTYEIHKTQSGHDAVRPVEEVAYVPQDLANVIRKPQTIKRFPAMPKKAREKRERTKSTEGENDQVILQTNVNGQAVQYILKMEPGAEIQGEDLERTLRAIADMVQAEHKEGEADGDVIIPEQKMDVAELQKNVDDAQMTYTAEGFADVLNAVVTGASQFESSNIDVVPTVTDIGSTQQQISAIESVQQGILPQTSTVDVIQVEQSLLSQTVIEPGQSLLKQNMESQNTIVETVEQTQFENTLLEAAQTATPVENIPNMRAPVSLLPGHSTGRLEVVPSSSTFQRYIITGNDATSVTAPTAEPAVITKLNSGQAAPVMSVTGDEGTTIHQTEDGSIVFTTDAIVHQEEPATQETPDELTDLDAEMLLSGVQGEGETIELSNGEKAVSHVVTLPDGRQVVVVLTPETSEPEAALSMLQLHGQESQ